MNALFSLPDCRLRAVPRPDPAALHLEVIPSRLASCRCPACGQISRSVHGSYRRWATDLPCSGQRVQLVVQVRRFRCHNAACARRTFSQRPDGLLNARVRRTRRLAQAQADVGLALGGEAAARLLDRLGMSTSATTVLRLVRALPLPVPETPRVVGVDDWAMKKGATYGALLVNLEARRVVDLLPDRTAGTLAGWLEGRCGVEIIARLRY